MAGTEPPQWLVPFDGGELREDICLANPRRRQLVDAVLFPPARVVFGAVGDEWTRATPLDGCCAAGAGSGGASCAATHRRSGCFGDSCGGGSCGGSFLHGGFLWLGFLCLFISQVPQSPPLSPPRFLPPEFLSQVETLNRGDRRAARSRAGG